MNKWWIIGGVIAIPLIGFAYYAISPFFITLEADDALPVSTEMSSSITAHVVGTAGHPAFGTVRVLEAEGKTYVRYENYETINGPDIYVYLAKDLDAKEYVSLGRVKATVGNANYLVPDGVNVNEYRYVLTWCKAFGVLFNSAEIGA